MAEYNPHVPDIVGQEWVPIIGQPYQPDSTQERGYSFSLNKGFSASPIVARYGRYSLDNVPSGVTTAQVPFMSVYRKGAEVDGPILRTVMECADAVSSGPDGAFFGSLTGGLALRNPSDDSGYSFTNGTAPISGNLDCSFDTSFGLPSQIDRVYNVSLLYTADGDGLEQATLPNSMLISLRYRGTDFYYSTGALDTGPSFRGDLNKIARISLGEINPNWSNATWQGTNERYPWTRSRLDLFSQASGDPMRIRFSWQSPTLDTDLNIRYLAMELTYSPFENRILYGGMHKGIDMDATGTHTEYGYGSDDTRNYVILRQTNTLVTGAATVLQPDEYTVTFNLADYGDTNQPIFNINAAAATNTRPTVSAIRELYQLPAIEGKVIDRVLTSTDTMSIEDSDIIPAIGIGITGSVGPAGGADLNVGSVGYSTPMVGDIVFISVPSQDFRSNNRDGVRSYPWIRFYARQTSGTPRDDTGFTFQANGTSGNTTASISSVQLAALPEIFDGWREVTLRFDVPPTWDGDASTIRTISWYAFQPGALNTFSTFQILGQMSPGPFQNAKYQGPIGVNTKAFFPLNPGYTGDYSFLFSTDPPTVTGVGVSTLSVPLTGIGTDCGLTPACVPTAVACNRVTWAPAASGTSMSDDFTRTVAAGWGTATSGQTWTNFGGSAADFSVTGGTGNHAVTTTNSFRTTVMGPTTTRDFDITVDAIMPTLSPSSLAGGNLTTSIIGRWVDASNFYEFQLTWRSDGGQRNGVLTIRRTLAGVDLQLTSSPFVTYMSIGSGNRIRIRAAAEGTTLYMKAWNVSDADTEPQEWQSIVSDTSFSQGQVGVRSGVGVGVTNALPIVFHYDDFSVLPYEFNFGYYELQRMDDDTPWQTIMKATAPAVTGFNDFEARIGMRSDYRIRQVNIYEFPGLWSTTVSNTLVSPVTGTGADGHELLVFTSNTNQMNGQTLAYEEVWDSNPVQEMTYFEGSGMVQFQRMYRRNMQVGFHALERGGVQFERTLLVQNAAVPAPILENAFQSLRDLAWDDLPYVCVRTNLGDRWYSAVEVPSGTISRGRKLQLVQVKITEVADEPYPVDPPGAKHAV